jgi:hypothetical protein
MRIIVPHNTTREAAIGIVDRSAGELFDIGAGTAVVLAEQKKSWTGPRMDFSLVAKVGFISVPLSGYVLVDDKDVTIECQLPALARNFIGEDKIRAGLERRIRGVLSA